ncbi:MalY/PatB family protein [Ileibacterium valens]|uniref:MalY/PatB family protein n=1 Tax=Ileibacterium valens TaxID=1862668 RepID=UPI00259B3E01|nr:PatB family C-S lyase [Ileibacterium valens]
MTKMDSDLHTEYDLFIDRSNTYSMKWEDGNDVLPFWVADMDIACSPAIVKAIKNRAASPIYGYTDIPDEWAKAYMSWFLKRHHWNLKEEELVYSNGVISALSSLVRRFSVPHEKVIVMTPVYGIFFNSIINNGSEPLEVPLAYQEGRYCIDFERLEQAFKDPQASLVILCNPHNPTGNLWSKEELSKIAVLAFANGVKVISDEVHCDIVRPGYEYIPFASVSENARKNSFILLFPSKAFNVAGLHTAAAAVSDPILRHQAYRQINTDEVGEPKVFSIPSAIAAYTESEEWIDRLQEVLFRNRDIAQTFISKEILELVCVPSNSLYLLWIDVSAICSDASLLVEYLKENEKIRLSSGDDFRGNGKQFIRMNLACPIEMLKIGLDRMTKEIKNFRTKQD